MYFSYSFPSQTTNKNRRLYSYLYLYLYSYHAVLYESYKLSYFVLPMERLLMSITKRTFEDAPQKLWSVASWLFYKCIDNSNTLQCLFLTCSALPITSTRSPLNTNTTSTWTQRCCHGINCYKIQCICIVDSVASEGEVYPGN
jgi:hypothetical protein